jgi:hypothetical protein
MPKFFDPINHPKRAMNAVTIYGSRLTFDGGSGSGTSGTSTISINGIANYVVATGQTSYDHSMVHWIAENYDFYYAKGFILTKGASAQVIVTPRYEWDTVNRISITYTGTQLTGSLIGVFEPDLRVAKTWHVTFGQHIVVLKPKNMVNGDKLRLELNATGNFTTTFADEKAFRWPGSTEYVVTTTTLGVASGTVNTDAFPREDRITLSGTQGTCTIVAGGLSKVCTWGASSLTQTAADFVTSWADAYAAIGLTVTAASGVLTFKVTDATNPRAVANFYAIPTVTLLTTDLFGTVVNVPAGRMVMDVVVPNIIP